jgi:hypothetical protein
MARHAKSVPLLLMPGVVNKLIDLCEIYPIPKEKIKKVSFFPCIEITNTDLMDRRWYLTLNAKCNGGIIFVDDAIACIRNQKHGSCVGK